MAQPDVLSKCLSKAKLVFRSKYNLVKPHPEIVSFIVKCCEENGLRITSEFLAEKWAELNNATHLLKLSRHHHTRRTVRGRKHGSSLGVGLMSFSTAFYYGLYDVYGDDAVDKMYELLEEFMVPENLRSMRWFFLPVGFDRVNWDILKAVILRLREITGDDFPRVIESIAKYVSVPSRFTDLKTARKYAEKIRMLGGGDT